MPKEMGSYLAMYGLKAKRWHVMMRNNYLINKGVILVNTSSPKLVKSFKAFGNLYSTNPRREKAYAFDDPFWKPMQIGFIKRTWWKFVVLYLGIKPLQGKPTDFTVQHMAPSMWSRLSKHYR